MFLISQTIKQHQIYDHTWNHVSNHPNVANDIISSKREEFLSNSTFSILSNRRSRCKATLKECFKSNLKQKLANHSLKKHSSR